MKFNVVGIFIKLLSNLLYKDCNELLRLKILNYIKKKQTFFLD